MERNSTPVFMRIHEALTVVVHVGLLCSNVAWRSEVVVSLARNSKAGDGEKKKNLEGGRVFWNFEIVSFVPLIMSSRAGF